MRSPANFALLHLKVLAVQNMYRTTSQSMCYAAQYALPAFPPPPPPANPQTPLTPPPPPTNPTPTRFPPVPKSLVSSKRRLEVLHLQACLGEDAAGRPQVVLLGAASTCSDGLKQNAYAYTVYIYIYNQYIYIYIRIYIYTHTYMYIDVCTSKMVPFFGLVQWQARIGILHVDIYIYIDYR